MPTTITIRPKGGEPLNVIADLIVSEEPDLISRLSDFQLIEKSASLFGSGDNAIVEIIIVYENLSKEDLKDIEEIIAIAEKGAADILYTRDSSSK